MEPVESGTGIWRNYNQSFREHAHQLLIWGYQDALSLICGHSEETEITGFIAEAIQAKLNSEDIDEYFDRYSIKDDNPVPGEGRTGKRRMRIDIIIECSERPRYRPRPKYVFEAKRLCRPNNRINKYIGSEGVLRFVKNRYASDCPEVAMVGYVQSDDITYWEKALKKELGPKSNGQLRIVSALSKISVLPELVDEWASAHTRNNGTPIIIFHLLLNAMTDQ